MRAIKFKAKSLDGVWVYGSFDSYDIAIIDESGAKWYINPETICQFVGITDRNGIDVYEDDLVQSKRGNTGRVVCSNLAWQVAWENVPMYRPLCYCIGAFVVIGNIHDSNHDPND